MRVLIAGGAGFIGSHLCDAVLADGHSVVCADNLLTGKAENIAHFRNELRFEVLQQDICRNKTSAMRNVRLKLWWRRNALGAPVEAKN